MRSRSLPLVLAILFVAACGQAQQPSDAQVEKEVEATLDRARKGEKVTETRSGLDPCAILGGGVVSELFGVSADAISYRPGSSSHPLCTASWRKPNAAEIEASSGQRMMDYMKRKMAAQSKGQPFDEKMPVARPEASVNLTIANQSFDSPAAAVAGLESLVAMMQEGRTVEVRGREVTTQTDYEWVDGVGDRAAWAPKLGQVSVAANGVLFHVGAEVADDDATDKAKALALAQALAGRI